jgi:tetratricopeptide (TPR) repeat protein
VVWILAATQPDGRPFAPGRYRFEIEWPDIRPAIVTTTGEPLPPNWVPGQWLSGLSKGHLELLMTAPSTPAEVAAMYVQRGQVAFERRQFDEAVALYRQAIDAHPSDAGMPLQRLGVTYLAMGRYDEALPVLQRLPIRILAIQAYLAEAFVGIGNEAEAVDLLRRNGWSQADVVARIDDLRARVRSTPRR